MGVEPGTESGFCCVWGPAAAAAAAQTDGRARGKPPSIFGSIDPVLFLENLPWIPKT